MIKITEQEFQKFRNFLEQQCGIMITEEKVYLIESRLFRLLIESGATNYSDFYKIIVRNADPKLTEKVIDAITTHETQWFRDGSPWELIRKQLMPRYIDELRQGKRKTVRIWSAACSTGQEPYSTAMEIDQYLETHACRDISLQQFEIIGTDISTNVVTLAKNAKYDNIAMSRGLPQEYKERYFSQQGRLWVLNEQIRNAVTFGNLNLQTNFSEEYKDFDLIFCRYVLIYFSNQLKQHCIKNFYQSMHEDGVFILGNSEILVDQQGLLDQQRENDSSIYYTRKKARGNENVDIIR